MKLKFGGPITDLVQERERERELVLLKNKERKRVSFIS